MADTLYLAELVVYDPGLPGTTTLRFSSGKGHTTGPAESPANTVYDPVLVQPGAFVRDMFDAGKTGGRSRLGFGNLVLLNANGALDALLTYGFSGRSATIRLGTEGAAYPAGFPLLLGATMEQAEAVGETIVIKLRDWQLLLEEPIQQTKFAGTNSLPSGLEGVAGDLLGKPKPLCFGSVQNVPAPCVNTTKLIYQPHDGAVADIPAVYDRGVALSAGKTWNSRTHALGTVTCCLFASSLYLAADDTGGLATSTDGTTWTARTSGFGATAIRGIAFGASLYVIVGDAGKLSSSPDGITWTPRTSQFGASGIQGVWFDAVNAIFVAVGIGGLISTSTNGTTWTARTSNFPVGEDIYAVTSGAGIIVAVGSAGAIATSLAGTTWTLRTTAILSTVLQAVVYANGTFVAVGAAGTRSWARSIDGVTWVAFASPFPTSKTAFGVAYSVGFVAVGTSGNIATSIDGTTWVVPAALPFGGSNMLAICVDGSGHYLASGVSKIYQTTTATYANTTDLLDDTKAPAAGCFTPCLGSGYFRLGSSPAGLVTADVSQGAAAANRTAAQLWTVALTKAGYAGTWNAGDVTALDALNAAVCGEWVFEEVTTAELLDRFAGGVGAWWGVDAGGVYRIKQFTAPSGTAVITLTANDLRQPLQRLAVADSSRGLPTWRSVLRYQKNYAVQDTDLAAAVTQARRTFVAAEWRESISESAAVKTAHLLADQTMYESVIQGAADAATEVARLQTLRGVLRNRYLAVAELNSETKAVDLGDVITLQHARYGLSAGVLLRVIGVTPDYRANQVSFTLWG